MRSYRSAFLAGGRHVVLPGVWHSVSRIGTFDEASGAHATCCARVLLMLLSHTLYGPYLMRGIRVGFDEASGESHNCV